MTFEERQRAEEEVAAFLHKHLAGPEYAAIRTLTKADQLVYLYGTAALMFDGHMGGGDGEAAAWDAQRMAECRHLFYKQNWMEHHPAA